ncbi:alpha-L-fucosidase [Nocardioides acrostichi]|uniref:alpha-L-fucosidase n=1 Tax=Nocardioides acrostichi TaxID=2784339 RepID=A0A930Y8Q0_9ACTN|nr:alpha-L-fucosidase [Nocardioides acrostichi]MBF4163342.1 alpha-L-fucosidase [Nocardioides acrostichi]
MRSIKRSRLGAAALLVAVPLTLTALPQASVGAPANPADRSTASDRPGPYEATWQSVDQHQASPAWFKNAKFGIYWHWGAFTEPEYGSEWYGRDMFIDGSSVNRHHQDTYGDPTEWGYENFIDGGTDKAGNEVQFKPVLKSQGGSFAPNAWARLFKRAGAQFAGPVAEHHDGYSMWDSDVNEWNSVDRGPNLDLLKIFSRAVRKQHMKLLVAMHHSFNFNGFYDYAPEQTDPSLQKLYGQLPRDEENQLWFDKLKEVIDEAHPDILWQDFGLDSPGYCFNDGPCAVDEQQRLNFLAYYYNQAQKWGKDVVATYKHFDSGFNTNGEVADYERGGPADIVRPYWLTDDAVSSSSWSYTQGIGYYSSQAILHALIDRVSKNGNMLLNVSPTKEGTIPQAQRDVLYDMGDYLHRNGESIYKTRAWDVYGEGPTLMGGGIFSAPKAGTAQDIRFTRSRSDRVLYATVLGWPGDGATLDIDTLGSDDVDLRDLSKVQLIGPKAHSYRNLRHEQTASALEVTMPSRRPVKQDAYVVKLTFGDKLPAPVSSGTAGLFERTGAHGRSARLAQGSYTASDLKKLGVDADKVRSLRVGAGAQVTVYPEDDFSGTPTTYTGDQARLARHSVGSVEVALDVSEPFLITNQTNGMVIDGDELGAGEEVAQHAADSAADQQWRLVEAGGDYYRIENEATGWVIDGLERSSGSHVTQEESSDADSQLWSLQAAGDGWSYVVNKATGLGLDSGGNVSDGAPLKQWVLDGSPNLRWSFTAAH